MRYLIFGTTCLFLSLPTVSFADNVCSSSGLAVVYINGIFTDSNRAESNRKAIEEVFVGEDLASQTTFHNGYNPTHIAGLGDVIKAILQKADEVEGTTKEDYDLLKIAERLRGEVKTQKILILGHSQGTFYANALYDYLIRRGVPARSISVLNIATPASYVAGHGSYLTNTNDNLVKAVRSAARTIAHPEPLSANLEIPAQPGSESDLWAGHSLADVYLKERPTEISSSIARHLARLESDSTRDPNQPCIPAPEMSVARAVKGAGLFALDVVGSAYGAVQGTMTMPILDATTYLAEGLGRRLAGVTGQSASAHESLQIAEDTIAPVVPNPAPVPIPGNQILPEIKTQIAPVAFVEIVQPPKIVEMPAEQKPEPETLFGFGGLRPIAPGEGGWGGGGGGSSAPQAQTLTAVAVASSVIAVPQPSVQFDPGVPAVTKEATVLILGTSSNAATTTITIGTTTIATTTSPWQFLVSLSEGGNVFVVEGTDAAGANARATTTVVKDTTPPATPTFSIEECVSSISTSTCLLVSTPGTLAITPDPDVSKYELFSTTTGNVVVSDGARVSLADNVSTSFTLAAIDAAGNRASSTPYVLEVMSRPVVINEVAWAGTRANAEDEWIELKNLSSHGLDMSRFSIRRDTGEEIALSGFLAAATSSNNSDIYLIERHSGATSADHSRNTLFTPLLDTGEELQLGVMVGSNFIVVDQTPLIATCGGWCAGSLSQALRFSEVHGTFETPRTMERNLVIGDGALRENWHSNDGYTRAASDAGGNAIYGTPKTENSKGLPLSSWYCGSDPHAALDGVYVPESTGCTYLSGFMHESARRFGALYKGVPGAATQVTSHSLGRAIQSEQSEGAGFTGVTGERFFATIWETRIGTSDVSDFDAWFMTGSTTSGSTVAPHSNYRIIEWTWGP